MAETLNREGPMAMSFRTVEAKRAFCAEWKRLTGEVFRPRRVGGENSGFWLRGAEDVARARDIATRVSGVNL